ncbi:hypothetical protein [Marinobacterium aestuariivivens]|uniref:Uncharacterized protein n=1 Tax=Marinobacterium aestuariivivens TaxID=1698799 RepID=A0ABW2A6V9_9GAMM
MTCALSIDLNKQSPAAHACRGIAADSWWVYRHEIGVNGQPLPWGRVVHYCRSEVAAKRWIRDAETSVRADLPL